MAVSKLENKLKLLISLYAGVLVATACSTAPRQDETMPEPYPIATAAMAAADTIEFPAAPEGFDVPRSDIPQGKIETIEYTASVLDATRSLVVYTPPGYSENRRYPVLYLLHGIGDDELGWWQKGSANVILDNLIAEELMVPMIVIMPNGRSSTTMTIQTPWGEQSPAFEAFENELLTDIIPFVESHYSVVANRDNRAIAGLSMGGGQTLNFGLSNLDTFAWIAAFSSAPNTIAAEELIDDPLSIPEQLHLFWISCGDQDGLLNISEGYHTWLTENSIPHIWHIDSGGHSWPVWKNDLYHVASMLFH